MGTFHVSFLVRLQNFPPIFVNMIIKIKENSINNWEEMTRKHTNNRMQKKSKDLGLRYGNQKAKKGRMDKQYDMRTRRTRRRLESGNTHRFTQNDTKKYQTGKRQAMVSGSRNSLPFTTD